MKELKINLYVFLIVLLFSLESQAQIFSGGQEQIIFAQNKVSQHVTWSSGFSLQENSLETKVLPTNQSQDIWIQTNAFPIGMSWRPSTSSGFEVHFDGSINELDAEFHAFPKVYLRYSCDKSNWSTWYEMNPTDKKTNEGSIIFKEYISLPQAAQEKYLSMEKEWWQTKPAWSSDEHEFCEWLVKKEPDFFAKEFPFIGYVQVRLEKLSVQSSQTVKSLTVKYNYAVSGLSSASRDKSKVRKNTGDKWFFTAEKK